MSEKVIGGNSLEDGMSINNFSLIGDGVNDEFLKGLVEANGYGFIERKPVVVACKNCKHWTKDHSNYPNYCGRGVDIHVPLADEYSNGLYEDFYCALFEAKDE